ncbi:urease accessory protein UreF [Thaumasiovibrio sp. DFM-14]|uniref:urease accessory protein UreF n=1 Tax=Thaumasiovibrio sp. DFM-14 TaxID=3384792 RepID=UPI0039A08A4D
MMNCQQQRDVACYRLFQLISPSLPVGGFTYSQGLEYAVEAGWVANRSDMEAWLTHIMSSSMATLELPIIDRIYLALESDELDQIEYWCNVLYTSRETSELRAEERQRGLALNTLLKKLEIDISVVHSINSQPNFLLGLCIAAHHWKIGLSSLKQGYLWSWLENIVTAGIKLIPLGQTDGQIALINITKEFPQAIESASNIEEWMIGSFTPSLAMASALHQTQYTRLFRS